jgi:hypothetical protein
MEQINEQKLEKKTYAEHISEEKKRAEEIQSRNL